MSEATKKLRLGGMALRNGLLVHGPTHWAAAVRRGDGDDRGRLRAQAAARRAPSERVPGVRGVSGSARRWRSSRSSSARCPRRGCRGRTRASPAPSPSPRSAARCCAGGSRAPGGEAAITALSVAARRSSRCAAATSPPTTASSTRRSAPTSRTRTTRAATKEHDRCGSHLMAPMIAANLAGTALLRRVLERPRRRRTRRCSSRRSAPRSRCSRGRSATRGPRRRARCAGRGTSCSACSGRASRPTSSSRSGARRSTRSCAPSSGGA